MQPLFFGNNILHLLPYLKCFYVKVGDQSLYQVGQQNEPPDDTGANDREKRAMQAAARAYMQIMKGG